MRNNVNYVQKEMHPSVGRQFQEDSIPSNYFRTLKSAM